MRRSIRVFDYESADRISAAVREVEIDEFSAISAACILRKIPDARFGFSQSVPDEDHKLCAEIRLEGTLPCDGKPTFHDLYIISCPNGTKIDEVDWETFINEILRNCSEFLHMSDQGCGPSQTTGKNSAMGQ